MSSASERPNPQQQLDRLEPELDLLARCVSHDLRQPLHVISGYVELVAFKHRDVFDAKGHQLVSKALDGVTRLNTMIDALVDLMRLDLHADREDAIDTNALVDAIFGKLSAQTSELGGLLERGDLPPVSGQPALLAQIFEQLLLNVLRFPGDAPPHGWVSARRLPRAVRFEVLDQGGGIDPRLHSNIFLPFGRGQDPRAGTGMGLAICRKVVDLHRGTMGLDSAPGMGSTFWFELPHQP